MIAVIFEVTPAVGKESRYFELAAVLKAELEAIDGFVSVERFQSLTTPGKFLSLSIWRDQKIQERRSFLAAQDLRPLGNLYTNMPFKTRAFI